MSPEVCLHFAAVFLNYFLRVIAGYLACWMLNRLLRKPRQRFLVWMIFLLGSGTYWLGIVLREARVFSAPATGAATTGTLTSSATHSLLVPLAWSHAIVVVVQIVGLAYLATAMGMIVMEAWRHVRMRVLLKWAVEPSDALNRLFQEICHDLRISRARLVILPGLKSPATAGWWTPRILLPEVCEEIGPTTQVADVLCHELIHVERRDYLWAAVSDLICCLLFFHPAIWSARKWMGLQGELACDLAVLAARPGDRADYADSLTYFVRLRMLQEGFSLGVDFAASATLGLRIRTILTAPKPLPWWRRFSHATVGLTVLVSLGILAPAVEIPLSFSESSAEQVSIERTMQTAAAHGQVARRTSHRMAAQSATPDSLTTLKTSRYVQETPAYIMTSGSSTRQGSEPSQEDSPAWRESQAPIRYPSVSSVVRSTLGEIAIGRARSHRDRDDH
jgi:D-alanyl-D-alanine endopeptidase (penicillin-binding protein 7)